YLFMFRLLACVSTRVRSDAWTDARPRTCLRAEGGLVRCQSGEVSVAYTGEGGARKPAGRTRPRASSRSRPAPSTAAARPLGGPRTGLGAEGGLGRGQSGEVAVGDTGEGGARKPAGRTRPRASSRSRPAASTAAARPIGGPPAVAGEVGETSPGTLTGPWRGPSAPTAIAPSWSAMRESRSSPV